MTSFCKLWQAIHKKGLGAENKSKTSYSKDNILSIFLPHIRFLNNRYYKTILPARGIFSRCALYFNKVTTFHQIKDVT
jgi:hypothetical protein